LTTKARVGGGVLVEEKTARELKKLLTELVDHSYGHHKAIHGLMKRVEELERRVKTLERGK
jgi:polyhydroxyalkanoate synthesis regulator phasin